MYLKVGGGGNDGESQEWLYLKPFWPVYFKSVFGLKKVDAWFYFLGGGR